MKRTRVALSPALKPDKREAVQDQHEDDGRIADNKVLSAVDKGHRYGNFHNYYNFNPTQERMKLLESGILDYVASNWKKQSLGTEITANTKGNSKQDEKRIKTGEEGIFSQSNADVSVLEKSESDYLTTFNYLDIGCNEGDLTMDVARALSKRLANDHHIQDRSSDKSEKLSQNLLQINVTGVDLDRILIERAKGNPERKDDPSIGDGQATTNTKSTPGVLLTPRFQVANALDDPVSDILKERFHLTSIFSTTMWIHIHGGDEGLARVLRNVCQQTEQYVLVEPQPSKCYRSAMVRLRKLGQPEFDVSSERLKFRPQIEDQVDRILKEQAFQRVVGFGGVNGENDKEKPDKTAWNRSLWLYERIALFE